MTIKQIVQGYNNVLIQDTQEMNDPQKIYPNFENSGAISKFQEKYPNAKEGIQTLAFQTENPNLMYVAKQDTLPNGQTRSAIYKYDTENGNLFKVGEMDENGKFTTPGEMDLLKKFSTGDVIGMGTKSVSLDELGESLWNQNDLANSQVNQEIEEGTELLNLI